MASHLQNRRQFLRSFVAGSSLMPGLLHRLAAADAGLDPLAPKLGHHPAKAKNVIFLFMTGGVSHVDTFDPKPKLKADAGKDIRYRWPGQAGHCRPPPFPVDRRRSGRYHKELHIEARAFYARVRVPGHRAFSEVVHDV